MSETAKAESKLTSTVATYESRVNAIEYPDDFSIKRDQSATGHYYRNGFFDGRAAAASVAALADAEIVSLRAARDTALSRAREAEGELAKFPKWWRDIYDSQPAEGQAIESLATSDDEFLEQSGKAHKWALGWAFITGEGINPPIRFWRPSTEKETAR